ncbi:MAG: hypothetical protein AB8B58_12985 [Roseobacter sp.]
MTTTIDIPRGDWGHIRVFAVNAPAQDVADMLAKAPKSDVARDLLGSPHLDTRSAEIFPVKDLEGLGLAQYLVDGYAVPIDTLADDRTKLEALEGYVLLLFSDSFAGEATALSTGARLTYIGAYSETLPDNAQRPVHTPSAAPYSGAPATDLAGSPRGSAARTLTVLALATAAGLLLWWLFT